MALICRTAAWPKAGTVVDDAVGEGGYKAVAGAVDPRRELVFRLAPDHAMEVGDDVASFNRQGNTAFNCGDGDGLGFRQVVSALPFQDRIGRAVAGLPSTDEFSHGLRDFRDRLTNRHWTDILNPGVACA